MYKENMFDATKLGQEEAGLKIVTWNINGIRSFKKGSLKGILDSLDADIICLQETKVTRDMVEEATAVVEGYSSYFGFCRKRSGYSGVVTYCKDSVTPLKSEEGLTGVCTPDDAQDVIGNYGNLTARFTNQELRDLDYEGRAVITQHEAKIADGITQIAVINLYCPNLDPEKPDRLDFKLNFFQLLEMRVDAIRETGSKIIVLGDMNISHKTVDHCDPIPEEEFNKDPCKQWLTSFLHNGPMFDLFRHLHPTSTEAFTCWNTKISARSTNYGTRIDYILVDPSLAEITESCEILHEVMGSDHCPVRAAFHAQPVPSNKCPSHCSRYFPEFSGKQTKLSDTMFRKRKADDDLNLGSSNDKIVKHASENDVKLSAPKPSKLAIKKQVSIKNFITSKTTKVVTETVPARNGSTESCLAFPNVAAVPPQNEQSVNACASGLWKSLLSGPKPPPPCKGHNEICVERTVGKKGPNFNRKFWVCARGEGRTNDPNARCNHFAWVPR